MKSQELKKVETSKTKAFVLKTIDSIINECDEKIKCYLNYLNDDFLYYFTVNVKSHVICTMKKQLFEQLLGWVEAEDNDENIVDLLDRSVEFMSNELLNYRRTQSTNELYNLKEEYKLEMYSKLIPLYKQISKKAKLLV